PKRPRWPAGPPSAPTPTPLPACGAARHPKQPPPGDGHELLCSTRPPERPDAPDDGYARRRYREGVAYRPRHPAEQGGPGLRLLPPYQRMPPVARCRRIWRRLPALLPECAALRPIAALNPDSRHDRQFERSRFPDIVPDRAVPGSPPIHLLSHGAAFPPGRRGCETARMARRGAGRDA